MQKIQIIQRPTVDLGLNNNVMFISKSSEL